MMVGVDISQVPAQSRCYIHNDTLITCRLSSSTMLAENPHWALGVRYQTDHADIGTTQIDVTCRLVIIVVLYNAAAGR